MATLHIISEILSRGYRVPQQRRPAGPVLLCIAVRGVLQLKLPILHRQNLISYLLIFKVNQYLHVLLSQLRVVVNDLSQVNKANLDSQIRGVWLEDVVDYFQELLFFLFHCLHVLLVHVHLCFETLHLGLPCFGCFFILLDLNPALITHVLFVLTNLTDILHVLAHVKPRLVDVIAIQVIHIGLVVNRETLFHTLILTSMSFLVLGFVQYLLHLKSSSIKSFQGLLLLSMQVELSESISAVYHNKTEYFPVKGLPKQEDVITVVKGVLIVPHKDQNHIDSFAFNNVTVSFDPSLAGFVVKVGDFFIVDVVLMGELHPLSQKVVVVYFINQELRPDSLQYFHMRELVVCNKTHHYLEHTVPEVRLFSHDL
mmetsp:Transcript_27055/g.28098  ORF Transcript_27055/g.28098 Transcript_27055/m.28098 type:complete len:369 (-) Transcript_27055:889-1995(-)